MDHEKGPSEEPYKDRKENLAKATSVELALFKGRSLLHETDRIKYNSDLHLDSRMEDRLGFSAAHSKMSTELINNIRSSLPHVEKRLNVILRRRTRKDRFLN